MSALPPELMTDPIRQLLVSGYMRQINDEFNSKYQLNIPTEINSIILLYTKEGIYVITFNQKPFGFSAIMDTRGKNCIVSSIQNKSNITKGMTVASRVYSINDRIVIDWKHKEIIKKMVKTPLPLKVAFIKVKHLFISTL